MTDGNTNCDRTDNANNTVRGTFVVTKGKWYWEVHVGKGSINANYPFSGMTGNLTLNPCTWVHEDSKTFSMSDKPEFMMFQLIEVQEPLQQQVLEPQHILFLD